jgi:hypothetical protein
MATFAHHTLHRCRYGLRLVEQFLDLETGRRGRTSRLKRFPDAVDDLEHGGIAILDDAQEHRTPAILAYYVLLNQPAVMDLANVLHEDGRAIHHLDRNIVEIIDAGRRSIGANGVLGIANLRVPEGKVRFCAFTAFTTSAGVSTRPDIKSRVEATLALLALPETKHASVALWLVRRSEASCAVRQRSGFRGDG